MIIQAETRAKEREYGSLFKCPHIQPLLSPTCKQFTYTTVLAMVNKIIVLFYGIMYKFSTSTHVSNVTGDANVKMLLPRSCFKTQYRRNDTTVQ